MISTAPVRYRYELWGFDPELGAHVVFAQGEDHARIRREQRVLRYRGKSTWIVQRVASSLISEE